MANGQLGTNDEINDQDDEALVTLQVTNLPRNTFEGPLRKAIEKVVPVEAVHIPVCYLTRKIYRYGYIILQQKNTRILLKRRYIFFCGYQININDSEVPAPDFVHYLINNKKNFSPPVFSWVNDVRPGHPDYRLPAPIEEPFDLSPPDQDEPSAHILVDDVLFIIFKKLKVCDLLRIERVCRRWQWAVRKILGGHTFVNFGDVNSLWGDFEDNGNFHGHPMLVEKLFILNGPTLEHLIISNMFIDRGNVRRAAKQCCPKLNHYFDVTQIRSCHTYQASYEPIHYNSFIPSSHLYVGFRKSKEMFQLEPRSEQIPKCVCTAVIDEDMDRETNLAYLDLIESFLG